MIKNVFAGVWISTLLASSALAGQPVTIQNSANTAAAGVTGTSLNVTCTSGCAGSSGTPSVVQGNVSNAGSGVATSATNVPNVSYNYGWNGTTWDQLKTAPAVPTTGVGVLSSSIVSQFNTTPTTYTNGQWGGVQMSARGALRSGMYTVGETAGRTAISGNIGYTTSDATQGLTILGTTPMLWNSSSSDASVSIIGAVAAGSAGTGTTAVEHAGSSFSEIAGATTTLVKSGATILHYVNVGTCVAAATVKIYNGLTAIGTPITITCGATAQGMPTNTYDAYFSTGITVVTSGATDVTISYR